MVCIFGDVPGLASCNQILISRPTEYYTLGLANCEGHFSLIQSGFISPCSKELHSLVLLLLRVECLHCAMLLAYPVAIIFKLRQGASIGSFCWMVGRMVGWLVGWSDGWLLEKSVEKCGN